MRSINKRSTIVSDNESTVRQPLRCLHGLFREKASHSRFSAAIASFLKKIRGELAKSRLRVEEVCTPAGVLVSNRENQHGASAAFIAFSRFGLRHGSGQFSGPAVPVLAAGEDQRLLGTDQRSEPLERSSQRLIVH
jgi:hypothetical protein